MGVDEGLGVAVAVGEGLGVAVGVCVGCGGGLGGLGFAAKTGSVIAKKPKVIATQTNVAVSVFLNSVE